MNNERLEKIEKQIEELKQMTNMDDLGNVYVIDTRRNEQASLENVEGKERDLLQEYNETKNMERREELFKEIKTVREEKKKKEVERLETIKARIEELLDRQNDLEEKITENEKAISEKEEEIKKKIVGIKKAEKEQEAYENVLKTMIEGELNVNDTDSYRTMMEKNEEKKDALVAENESLKEELKELESLKQENEGLKKAYAYIEEELVEFDEQFSLKVQEEPVVENAEAKDSKEEPAVEEDKVDESQVESAVKKDKVEEQQVGSAEKPLTQADIERLMAGENIEGLSPENPSKKPLTQKEIEELLTGKSVEEGSKNVQEEPINKKVETEQPKTEPTARKVEPEQQKAEAVARKVEPVAKKVEPEQQKPEPIVRKVESKQPQGQKKEERLAVKSIKEVGFKFEAGIPYYYAEVVTLEGKEITLKLKGYDKVILMDKKQLKEEEGPKNVAEAEKYYDVGMQRFLKKFEICEKEGATPKNPDELYDNILKNKKNPRRPEQPFKICYDLSNLDKKPKEKENKARLFYLKRIAKANSKVNVAEYIKNPSFLEKIWDKIKNRVPLLTAGKQAEEIQEQDNNISSLEQKRNQLLSSIKVMPSKVNEGVKELSSKAKESIRNLPAKAKTIANAKYTAVKTKAKDLLNKNKKDVLEPDVKELIESTVSGELEK